jgi:hypothetical protein
MVYAVPVMLNMLMPVVMCNASVCDVALLPSALSVCLILRLPFSCCSSLPVSSMHPLLLRRWVAQLFFMDPEQHQYRFFSWNVRGLNSASRQEDVRQVINIYKPDLVCLQETKMESAPQAVVRNVIGPAYQDNFVFLPGCGSSGGIIIDTNSSCMSISNTSLTSHTISVSVLNLRINTSWMLTAVYGPQGTLEKKMFIREMRHLKQSATPNWLILGDFNLIYKDDKSSGHLDRNLMHKFRRALNHLEVKEI